MIETRITLGPETERVLANLREAGPTMRTAIARTLDRENELTIGRAQSLYMTGPRPAYLGVRTGRLRRSLRRNRTRVTGDTITSSIGTNVEYAARHEYGFEGTERVSAHRRRVSQAFGRKLSAPVSAQVSAHNRRVRSPSRPFLTPAIEDRIPAYAAALELAITTALSEE